MSGIVLSASVRQNLLSLQSTAALLATTQNRPRHRQQGQLRARQPHQLLHRAVARTTAPATSAICSMASATACRCCRPPTPASPRCRAWSPAPSRSPTRCCRARSATRRSPTSPRPPSPARPPTTCSAPAAASTRLRRQQRQHRHCRCDHHRDQCCPVPATTSSNDLATAIATSDTLVVNGTTFAFVAGTSSSGTSIGIGDTVAHLLSTINAAAGVTASISGGAITGRRQHRSRRHLSGTALAKLALTARRRYRRARGQTLTVAATGGGTRPASPSAWHRSGLDPERAQHGAGRQQPAGHDRLRDRQDQHHTTNDAASSTIGTIGGTAVADRRRPSTACGCRAGCRPERAVPAYDPGGAVQQRADADQHHGAGRVLQRRQPAERRSR